MRQIYLFITSILLLTLVSGGSQDIALAASRFEGAIPMSGDPCGGTGGNGRIISVGSNSFTVKHNVDNRNLTVRLSSQAEIKTSSGPIPLSQLKAGESVTLAGSPNGDSGFLADLVAVCSGPQTNRMQVGSINKVKAWSAYIAAAAIILACLIWCGVVAFLRLKKKQSLVYVLFFTIFYIYIIEVLNYTLFQYQSLILLKQVTSGLMLNGQAADKSLNLIPLLTLRLVDVKTSLLNILLMLPFGFGLPFITSFRMKKVVLSGMAFSVTIELLQFITGRIAGITFRIADINDVIFNTLGVAIGYWLFVVFIRLVRHQFSHGQIAESSIFRYIVDRPQIDTR